MPEDSPLIPKDMLKLMHEIGYVHESEIEALSGTTSKSRARWRSPRGVMFGNQKWFQLEEIKKHLDAKLEEKSSGFPDVKVPIL